MRTDVSSLSFAFLFCLLPFCLELDRDGVARQADLRSQPMLHAFSTTADVQVILSILHGASHAVFFCVPSICIRVRTEVSFLFALVIFSHDGQESSQPEFHDKEAFVLCYKRALGSHAHAYARSHTYTHASRAHPLPLCLPCFLHIY